jgi:hypothetical protein
MMLDLSYFSTTSIFLLLKLVTEEDMSAFGSERRQC